MTAQKILYYLDLRLGTARKGDVIAAYRAADEEGTIQACDMVKLMGGAHPERHTTASMRQALIWLGCKKI